MGNTAEHREQPNAAPLVEQGQLRVFGLLYILLAAVLALLVVSALSRRVTGETIIFDSDEAVHAVPGLELYVALQRGDVVGFARGIARQSFYPPVHSFTVLASYMMAGPSLAASRMPTVLTFALVLIGLAGLIYAAVARRPAFGRGIALVATGAITALVATSPTLIRNSVLCMLELLGCLWVVGLLWLCEHLDGGTYRRSTRAALLASGLLLISFTKYSFGLIVAPATLAAMLTGPDFRAPTKSQLGEAAAVLGALMVTLGAWFAAVGIGAALRFAFDQPQYAPRLSVENVLFYPLAWLTSFHLHAAFGVVTAMLALWAAINNWDRFVVRAASWIVVFGLLVLTISLNNQPRHIAIAGPGMWLLAGIGLAQLLALTGRTPRLRLARTVTLTALLPVIAFSVVHRADELPAELTYAFEGGYGTEIATLQPWLVDNLDFEGRILMFGLYDRFNGTAIRWRAAITTDRAPSEIRFDGRPRAEAYPEGTRVEDSGASVPDPMVLRAIAAGGYYDQIVIIHAPESGLVAVSNALEGYRRTSNQVDGWRVEIFDTGRPGSGDRQN